MEKTLSKKEQEQKLGAGKAGSTGGRSVGRGGLWRETPGGKSTGGSDIHGRDPELAVQATEIHSEFPEEHGAMVFRMDQGIKRSASGRAVGRMPG